MSLNEVTCRACVARPFTPFLRSHAPFKRLSALLERFPFFSFSSPTLPSHSHHTCLNLKSWRPCELTRESCHRNANVARKAFEAQACFR
jgi:hypothetical protein